MPKDVNLDKLSESSTLIAIFLFYNLANGPQAKLAFSKDLKHCNCIIYDGLNFVLVEFDSEGLKHRVIKAKSIRAVIRNLKVLKELSALICVDIYERRKTPWFPWWVRSCNEVSRYASGVDIAFCFNPSQLYKALLRYNGKRNYVILDAWRR